MTPHEKAKELVDKFKHNTRAFNETNGWEDTLHNAKQCALIAVDEIIRLLQDLGYDNEDFRISYELEVKKEINKL